MRLIDQQGNMVGVVTLQEALLKAKAAELDLAEIAAQAEPPVVKIIDMGKYRYDQQKKLKDQKKAQHQSKIKEVKFKPNIDTHDLETKIRHAKDFLEKRFKVRITCSFRGREMAHTEIGRKVLERVIEALEEFGQIEAPLKMMGRIMSGVLAPAKSKKLVAPKATTKLESSRAESCQVDSYQAEAKLEQSEPSKGVDEDSSEDEQSA